MIIINNKGFLVINNDMGLTAPDLGLPNGFDTTGMFSMDLNLSSEYFVVEGRELNIYWENVIRTFFPLDLFNIDVTCTKGDQFARGWRLTPIAADAGTYTLTLTVSMNDTVLATKNTTINVVALTSGTGVSRKALVIGDSTTAGGGSTGELVNLFTGDAMSLTLIGTKGTGANKHEGVSGKTYNFFKADPTSPFYFSGSFNFSQYLSTNGFTMSSGDWVIWNLGINDVFSQLTDSSVDTTIASIKSDLDSMITNIKSAVSGIKIGVCLTIPPSASQDAFGDDYGNGTNRKRYARNRKRLVNQLIAYYDTAPQKAANIFVIPIDSNLDTVNNMALTLTTVNDRGYVSENFGIYQILWQTGNIIRYSTVGQLPNDIVPGMQLKVTGAANSANNGTFQIVNTDFVNRYVYVVNAGRSNNTADESSDSPGVGTFKRAFYMMSNGVHPAAGGYYQIADVYYSFLKVKA